MILAPTSDKQSAEQEDTERLLLTDYSFYANSLLHIINKESQLVTLKRNTVQKMIAEIKRDIKARGRRIRAYILKGRQFGVSTDQLGENFHRTSTNFNKTALFVAHEPVAKTRLFDIIKLMYDTMPADLPEWKPEIKKNNAKELAFEGINSTIRVGCAEEENTGSGQTINYLHLSELPKYPRNKVGPLLTSLFQAVPETDPDSEIIIEGTAYGIGGEFYDGFWGARYVYEGFLDKHGRPAWKMAVNPDADKQNEWASIFLPWFLHDEYEMDPEPGFERTAEEQLLVDIHRVNDCKLAWRRWAIVNKCRGSAEIFAQEYATTARGAFLSSGRPVFDPIDQIDKRMHECKPAIAYYTLLGRQWVTAKPIAGDTDGILQVWEEPIPGREYLVSADISEGLEHGDFDSADVMEKLTGKQVAHWHGHTSPDKFGAILYCMGQRYGFGWVAPERNNHGLTTITQLVNMNYPNICPEINVKPGEQPRKHYGFLTGSSKTGGKSVIIDEMAAMVREQPENIQCAETCGEMLTFKHNADGTMGAEQGHFDDRVMSYAIGNFVRTRLKAAKLPEDIGVAPSSTPPTSAWM